MHIVKSDMILADELDARAAEREADRHARMLEEIYLDLEDLDPETCPPDRRYYLRDKQAWVYEHGNIAELVFVRSAEDRILDLLR